MLLDVICAVLFEKRLSSVFTRKHSRQVESARKYTNHPFAGNLSRIPICVIFAGLKVVLFKRETFVSEFLFKLFDREKVLHNCNRQNIHVAETTCTSASANFFFFVSKFSAASVHLHQSYKMKVLWCSRNQPVRFLSTFLNFWHVGARERFTFVNSVAVQSGVPRFQEKPLAVTGYTTLENLGVLRMDVVFR